MTDFPEDIAMDKIRKELGIKTLEQEEEMNLYYRCVVSANRKVY